jgi:hypothetical protein
MQYLHNFLVAASCANVGSKTLISLNDVQVTSAAAAKPLNGIFALSNFASVTAARCTLRFCR